MNIEMPEKVLKLSNQIVFYSEYRNAYAIMKKSVACTKNRNIPSCAVVTGPAGSGKSTLAKFFNDSFPPASTVIRDDGLYTITPAFLCTIPAQVTVKSFLKTLLINLGNSDTGGDTVDLIHRCTRLLLVRGVEVIIIDEFQRLARANAVLMREGVIDCLVTLINLTNIPFVLIGTDECLDLIYSRDVLARRFPFRVELHYPAFSVDPKSDYQALLSTLDKKLYTIGELNGGLHLSDHMISAQLYLATKGNLEYLKLIICNALEFCLLRGDGILRISDLSDATDELYIAENLAGDNSPFKLSPSRVDEMLEACTC
ncbi:MULTISPECIES: ATP-binding protein [unclassified Pseudomonas]|uniref:ATP-binding protein n=1 Tax=unclassified Pseudomonas TaxID=196821 RepID=UPI00257D2084|nr:MULTISPECIES: ATP-binding protein [unclassified Pseudomonas]